MIGAHPRPYSNQLRPPVKIQSACLVYILKIIGMDFSAAKREKIENFEIPITKKSKFYNIFSAAKMETMKYYLKESCNCEIPDTKLHVNKAESF